MKRKMWYLKTSLLQHHPFARENPYFRENIKKLRWYLDRTDLPVVAIAKEFEVSRQAIFQAMERVCYDYPARALRVKEKMQREKERRRKGKKPRWYTILHRICQEKKISCEPHSSWKPNLAKLNGKSVYVRLTATARLTRQGTWAEFSTISRLLPLRGKPFVAIQAVKNPPVPFIIPGRAVRAKSIDLPVEEMVFDRSGKKRRVPSRSKWWKYKEAWHFIR